MFEDVRVLLEDRKADLQADIDILAELTTESLPPDRIWRDIISIRDGYARFTACQEFLEDMLGKGCLGQAGDVHVNYMTSKVSVTLPGAKATDKRIMVCITGVYSPKKDLTRPAELPITEKERFAKDYVSLLQRGAGFRELVEARNSEAKDWSTLRCWFYSLYYQLCDGRRPIAFYENVVSSLQAERQVQNERNLLEWAARREKVRSFMMGPYSRLAELDFPVCIGLSDTYLPAEEIRGLIE